MLAETSTANGASLSSSSRGERGTGRLLGGALFAAAQHAVLLERVLAAWDKCTAQNLKRRSLAAWAQAAREARENAGWPMMVQILEEEVERLGDCYDEQARCADILRKELQEERSRRLQMEQIQSPAFALPLTWSGGVPAVSRGPPDVAQLGSSCATPQAGRTGAGSIGAACFWPAAVPRGMPSFSSASSVASGGSSFESTGYIPRFPGSASTMDCPDPADDERARKLASTVQFLFLHIACQHWGTLREAHRSCCDRAGCVSRRAFTGLVVEVLGKSLGVAAELLAEVVGVVWPSLDLKGSGVVGEADFLRLAAHGGMITTSW